MNIICLMQYGPGVKEEAEIAVRNRKKYCKKHGYDLMVNAFPNRITPEYYVEQKYLLIQKYLPDHDYIWWSNALDMVVNSSIRLESFLESGRDIIGSGLNWQTVATPVHIVTTNMFFKNSDWTNNTFFSEFDSVMKSMIEQGKHGSTKINYFIDPEAMVEMWRRYPGNFKVLPTKELHNVPYHEDVGFCKESYRPGAFSINYTLQMKPENRIKLMRAFESESKKIFGSPLPGPISQEKHKDFLQKIGAIK